MKRLSGILLVLAVMLTVLAATRALGGDRQYRQHRPVVRPAGRLADDYSAEPFRTHVGALNFLASLPPEQAEQAVLVALPGCEHGEYVVAWRPDQHGKWALEVPRLVVVIAFQAGPDGEQRQDGTRWWYSTQGLPVAVATGKSPELRNLVIATSGF